MHMGFEAHVLVLYPVGHVSVVGTTSRAGYAEFTACVGQLSCITHLVHGASLPHISLAR